MSDGSFLLIALTKPEKPQGSMKVVMVPGLYTHIKTDQITYFKHVQHSGLQLYLNKIGQNVIPSHH